MARLKPFCAHTNFSNAALHSAGHFTRQPPSTPVPLGSMGRRVQRGRPRRTHACPAAAEGHHDPGQQARQRPLAGSRLRSTQTRRTRIATLACIPARDIWEATHVAFQMNTHCTYHFVPWYCRLTTPMPRKRTQDNWLLQSMCNNVRSVFFLFFLKKKKQIVNVRGYQNRI